MSRIEMRHVICVMFGLYSNGLDHDPYRRVMSHVNESCHTLE